LSDGGGSILRIASGPTKPCASEALLARQKPNLGHGAGFRPTWRACKHRPVPPPTAHLPGARSGTTPAIRLSAGLDSQPDRCFHHLQFAKPAVRVHGSPE